jgi:hypothetical protein
MKEVSRYIKKWKSRMFLQEWMIEVKFAKEDRDNFIADISACPVYLKAVITVYPCFKKLSADEKENAIIHELAHCHTQELFNLVERQGMGQMVPKDLAVEALERLTQRMANIAQLD